MHWTRNMFMSQIMCIEILRNNRNIKFLFQSAFEKNNNNK